MKKKRLWIAYGLCMAAVAIWLGVSTSIVIHFDSDAKRVEKVSLKDYLPAMREGDVQYFLESLQPSSNFAEDLGVYGWAFVETESENEGRYVTLLLRGEKHCYALRCDSLIRRPDVQRTFGEAAVPNVWVGFGDDFATASMDNGLYEAWVYCWENDEDYGLINTGIWYEKRGAKFTQVDFMSKKKMWFWPVQTTKASTALDELKSENGNLSLKGWALAEGKNCDTQKIYVQVRDSAGKRQTYTTGSLTRKDVAAALNDDQYVLSGYQACFPMEWMSDGTGTIYVFVANGGWVWCSQGINFTKSGEEVERTS